MPLKQNLLNYKRDHRLISLVLLLVFSNIGLYLLFYRYNLLPSQPIAIALFAIICVVFALRTPYSVLNKVILSCVALVCSIVLSYAAAFLAMVTPGSRSHDYVMYHVCLPAIREHYGLHPSDSLSMQGDMLDKDGWSKSWYQHLECEQNVYAGRGPIFSENPPDFHPVKEAN